MSGQGFVALDTEAGTAFVQLEHVSYVSAPFQKGKHQPAVAIGFPGSKLYILHTQANFQTLGLLWVEPVKPEPVTVQASPAKRARAKRQRNEAKS